MFFNKYPYTDFSQINLDWLVGKMHELMENAGIVKKVAGVSPDQSGNIPAGQLKEALGASDAGVFTVTASIQGTYQDMVLDKTWQEIMDAVKAGKYVQLQDNTSSGGTDDYYTFGFVAAVGHASHYDVVVYLTGEGGWSSFTLYTSSANGYPQTHNV